MRRGQVEREDRDLGDDADRCAARGTCRRSASTPTASGSDAATTLPNTKMSRSSVIGKAIDSAVAQVALDRVADLAEDLGEAADADVEHVGVHAVLGRAAARTRSSHSSCVPLMLARTSAFVPSLLRSGGGEPSDQYDTACSMEPSLARLTVRAMPAAATAGSSTVPCLAVTSSRKLGCRRRRCPAGRPRPC